MSKEDVPCICSSKFVKLLDILTARTEESLNYFVSNLKDAEDTDMFLLSTNKQDFLATLVT